MEEGDRGGRCGHGGGQCGDPGDTRGLAGEQGGQEGGGAGTETARFQRTHVVRLGLPASSTTPLHVLTNLLLRHNGPATARIGALLPPPATW